MRQRRLLYLLTTLLVTILMGCDKDSVEKGNYTTWVEGMAIVEVDDNYLYFVPTADKQGMMLTYDRTNMSYERMVQMNGGVVDADEGGSGQKGLLTYQGHVDIPATVNGLPVTAIDQYAFSGNGELTAVTIPESVTVIGAESFAQCPKLTVLTLPASVTEIKAGTFCGQSVSELYIPDAVKTISHFAFLKNTMLTTIHLDADNSQLEEIGASAFSGCTSLTGITLNQSLKRIGKMAFNGCSKLTEIHLTCSTPPAVEDVISSKATIYIPAGSLTAYQAAPFWSDITKYVEE